MLQRTTTATHYYYCISITAAITTKTALFCILLLFMFVIPHVCCHSKILTITTLCVIFDSNVLFTKIKYSLFSYVVASNKTRTKTNTTNKRKSPSIIKIITSIHTYHFLTHSSCSLRLLQHPRDVSTSLDCC